MSERRLKAFFWAYKNAAFLRKRRFCMPSVGCGHRSQSTSARLSVLTHNNIGSFSGRFIAVVKNQLKATSAYRLAQHTLSGQAVTQFKPCIGGEAAKRLGTAA